MIKKSISTMVLGAGLGLAAVAPAHAVAVRASLTVDNSYALYYGTATAATNYVATDNSWGPAEVYNFNLPANNYLYVVTASDVAVAQGFLGMFENLDTGFKFYSDDPQWQVMATGLGPNAPYMGTAGDLALLTQEILDANAGGNASQGWVNTVAGPANGSAPWGPIANIDSAARWVWHSSDGDNDPTSPGIDHDEWLVFRIRIGATPTNDVPEPGTLALLGLAAGACGLSLRRKKA